MEHLIKWQKNAYPGNQHASQGKRNSAATQQLGVGDVKQSKKRAKDKQCEQLFIYLYQPSILFNSYPKLE